MPLQQARQAVQRAGRNGPEIEVVDLEIQFGEPLPDPQLRGTAQAIRRRAQPRHNPQQVLLGAAAFVVVQDLEDSASRVGPILRAGRRQPEGAPRL